MLPGRLQPIDKKNPLVFFDVRIGAEFAAPACKENPIVYMDIRIDHESAGRLVIELRKDVVPKTAENFRALCTGECGIGKLGKPLHYKGTKFHKVTRVFASHSGDVVNNDGSCGESIYGIVFDDENFDLKHEEGVISMSNYGKPDSNNSQFMITTVNCDHLNGTNVVCGRVIRGMGIIFDMEQNTTDESIPTKDIVIEDCGEIPPGEDWGFCDNDETTDKLPPYPNDWCDKVKAFTSDEMITLLTNIRASGNFFFKQQRYYEARRKYRKADRYCAMLNKRPDWDGFGHLKLSAEDSKKLNDFIVVNNLNMSAVELKLKEFKNAKYVCDEALKLDENCGKAYYRRGQAQIELKNYDEAILDFKKALELAPGDKAITSELARVRKLKAEYDNKQKNALKSLFN